MSERQMFNVENARERSFTENNQIHILEKWK